jgi:hypothetical protein
MTADKALETLKSWITHRTTAYPALAGIPIILRDSEQEQPGDDDAADADTFDATHIVLNDTSSEEHPVLRGVLTVSVEAMLVTATGDLGKTDVEHRALNADLWNILADRAAVTYCDNQPGFRCFDLRGNEPTSETGDGVRTTTFALSIVGAASA